jgi:hypothetical protein
MSLCGHVASHEADLTRAIWWPLVRSKPGRNVSASPKARLLHLVRERNQHQISFRAQELNISRAP